MYQIKIRGTDQWLTRPDPPAYYSRVRIVAWERGFDARASGYERGICAYIKDASVKAWHEGWSEADRLIAALPPAQPQQPATEI